MGQIALPRHHGRRRPSLAPGSRFPRGRFSFDGSSRPSKAAVTAITAGSATTAAAVTVTAPPLPPAARRWALTAAPGASSMTAPPAPAQEAGYEGGPMHPSITDIFHDGGVSLSPVAEEEDASLRVPARHLSPAPAARLSPPRSRRSHASPSELTQLQQDSTTEAPSPVAADAAPAMSTEAASTSRSNDEPSAGGLAATRSGEVTLVPSAAASPAGDGGSEGDAMQLVAAPTLVVEPAVAVAPAPYLPAGPTHA